MAQRRYRPRDSYVSKDPEKRQKQLANLKSMNRGKAKTTPLNRSADIISFAESHFYIPETRKPVVLLDWEKDIFRALFDSEPKPSLGLLGMPKKSGKSTIAAIIALWMFSTRPMAEIYCMGPDMQQGQLVVFDKCRKAVRMNPRLRTACKVSKDKIEYGDRFIMVLPCSKTAAGLNPDLVILDELWQFTTTEAERAFDEMTTTPTKEMLSLIVSYAGYQDEVDTPLHNLYKQGTSAEKDDKFYFLWRTDYKGVPWVTAEYLATQKKRLRENTYLRLHCNQWVSSEEAFIGADVLDMCTNKSHLRGQKIGQVCIGLDVGYSHDCTAVAAVGKIDDETLALIDHAIFVPPRKGILDLEKTFEDLLTIYNKEYNVRACYFDPYQAIRSAQGLKKKGVPMQEYPQTPANLVKMASTLQGLLKTGGLMLYEDADVRQHLLNAKVKESSRGWRIVKSTQAQKIDLCVALAMAVQAAADNFLLRIPVTLTIINLFDDDDDDDSHLWTPCGAMMGW